MKIYLPILFFLLMLPKPSFGQGIPIDSFYRDGATWTKACYFENSWCSHCITQELKGYNLVIMGDSVIQGGQGPVDYKLLYYRFTGGYLYDIPVFGATTLTFNYPDSINHYLGRIRISDRKVFFTLEIEPAMSYGCWTPGTELLLFDFGLNVGDTLNYMCNSKITISSIDSLQLQSGIYLKKYESGMPTIEGIGNFYEGLLDLQSMLFTGPFWGAQGDYFLCYENKELSYYTQNHSLGYGFGENCFIRDTTTGVDSTNNNNNAANNKTGSDSTVTIYPNPLKGNPLHVLTDNNSQIEKIELYDMISKVCQVYEHPFQSWTENELRIPFKTGVYFVKIVFADKSYVVKRLVKL